MPVKFESVPTLNWLLGNSSWDSNCVCKGYMAFVIEEIQFHKQ